MTAVFRPVRRALPPGSPPSLPSPCGLKPALDGSCCSLSLGLHCLLARGHAVRQRGTGNEGLAKKTEPPSQEPPCQVAGVGLRPAGLGWSCLCSHRSHDCGETDGCRSSSWWGQSCPCAIKLGHASATHRTEQSCLQGPVQGQNATCSFLQPLLRVAWSRAAPGEAPLPRVWGLVTPSAYTPARCAPGRRARCRGTCEYSPLFMLFLKLNFMFFPQLAYITFSIIKQHNFLNSFIRRRLVTSLRFNL